MGVGLVYMDICTDSEEFGQKNVTQDQHNVKILGSPSGRHSSNFGSTK